MEDNISRPKVLIFGATGKLGKRLLKDGLDAGYSIAAFVRNSAKIVDEYDNQIPKNLIKALQLTQQYAVLLRNSLHCRTTEFNCYV